LNLPFINFFDLLLIELFFIIQPLIKIFTQLILGINEFHKNKILHRDLKLSNIFVDNNDNVQIGLEIMIIYYLK
jgi:serine/threonine protein kinase